MTIDAKTFSAFVMRHLRHELSRPDPWRLESSPFEHARHAAMARLIGRDRLFQSALEVGCAAGLFTAELAARCARLRVLDILPEALDRTRSRLGPRAEVAYTLADIADCPPFGETYDLIVATEVFYYLHEPASAARAVAHLADALRPGGFVLFGSATDAVCGRWGLRHGAEALTPEWSRQLREIERCSCRGSRPDEHALLVLYAKPG
jgi:SAM-dependent methyltransferase